MRARDGTGRPPPRETECGRLGWQWHGQRHAPLITRPILAAGKTPQLPSAADARPLNFCLSLGCFLVYVPRRRIAFFSPKSRSAVFEGPPLRIALCIKGARLGRRHILAPLPAPECPSGRGPGAATRSPRQRPTAAAAFTAELAWSGQENVPGDRRAANVRAGAPAPGRAPRGERAGRGRPPLRSRGQSGMGARLDPSGQEVVRPEVRQ